MHLIPYLYRIIKSLKSQIIKTAKTFLYFHIKYNTLICLLGSWVESEIMSFFVFSHMHVLARNWSKATVKIRTKTQLRILPLIQLFLCNKYA